MNFRGVVGRDDEVIEITTYFACGTIVGGELISRNLRATRRQQAQLDPPADGKFLFHPLALNFFLDQPARPGGHNVHHMQGELRRAADNLLKSRPVDGDQPGVRNGCHGGTSGPVVDQGHLAEDRPGHHGMDSLALSRHKQLSFEQDIHHIAGLILQDDDGPCRHAGLFLVREETQ